MLRDVYVEQRAEDPLVLLLRALLPALCGFRYHQGRHSEPH